MCNKCEELVKCPVGEKRVVEVEKPTEPLFIDSWMMFVSKWPDGKIEGGLYREIYDENFVQYGGSIDITHCPFCGEKFA